MYKMGKKSAKKVKELTPPKKKFSWVLGIIFIVIIVLVIISIVNQNKIPSIGQATTSGGDYESSDCDNACNSCTETCEYDRTDMKYKWVYDHWEKVPVKIYQCKDNGRVTCSTWNPLDDNCCTSYQQCFALPGYSNDCFPRCKVSSGWTPDCMIYHDPETCQEHGCSWDDRDYV